MAYDICIQIYKKRETVDANLYENHVSLERNQLQRAISQQFKYSFRTHSYLGGKYSVQSKLTMYFHCLLNIIINWELLNYFVECYVILQKL